MKHQSGLKKLNLSAKHRKSLLRNQVIHFIKYGLLRTTSARVKEVVKIVERVVTIAKSGNTYNNRRKVNKIIPYDMEIVEKLFKEVAPRFVDRPGGYTRRRLLGVRTKDTAMISQISWVA